MNNPFFTVIIPTFNRSEMLGESIQSVLDQTFKDFEIIVIDDHSTDNTKEVVASIHDDRLKYIVNDHLKGNSGARNAGIFKAQGTWVAFLDDDDTWISQKLELVYKKICTVESDVGLIYTGFAYFNSDTGKVISLRIPELSGWVQDDLLFTNKHIGTPSAASVRTDILHKAGGFDENINHGEDAELYVRIAELCKVDFIKEVLTLYRISNQDRLSISLQNGLNSFYTIWKKHKAFINKNPLRRHRAASQVFRFAVKAGSVRHIAESLPWTIAGLFFDTNHFLRTVWTVISEKLKRDNS